MSYKVCLLSDHHLCINPRVWKEAFFFERKGYEVVVITMWQSRELLTRDLDLLAGHSIEYKPYLNLIPGEIPEIRRFLYRIRRRVASEVQRFFKIGLKWAISHAPELMRNKALEEKADWYVAHLETAFHVGRDLIRSGKKVGYDFEDWYSHDYLVPGRAVKLLEEVERFALKNGWYCTASSKSMAEALSKYYCIKKDIPVIYNGFPDDTGKPDRNSKALKQKENVQLIWLSRNIGPERGIEYMLKALPHFNRPVEIHMVGLIDYGYKEFLIKTIKEDGRHELVIHEFLPHAELDNFIAQFDIGLAIEENINGNKTVAVSNKILQYLKAGLPVIASDTKGQKEVAAYFPDRIQIIDLTKPAYWVRAIDRLMNLKNEECQDSQDRYRQVFSWNAQEEKLENIISSLYVPA